MIASCRSSSLWPVLGLDRHEGEAVRELILKVSMSVAGFVSDLNGRD
jgi:hypothetical protein